MAISGSTSVYGSTDLDRNTAVVDVDVSQAGPGGATSAKALVVSAPGLPASRGPLTAAGSLSTIAAGSGITATASFTPIAGPYSANDLMGAAQEFAFTYADGTPVRPGSLIRILTSIVKIDQTALQTAEGAYQLRNYSVTPPSALADNAAWTLASGDLSAYRGAVALGTPVDEGAACYIKTPNIDLDIKLAAGSSSLFAYLQTLAGLTVAASPVVRQILLYGIEL